jgi:hypothetical protein
MDRRTVANGQRKHGGALSAPARFLRCKLKITWTAPLLAKSGNETAKNRKLARQPNISLPGVATLDN